MCVDKVRTREHPAENALLLRAAAGLEAQKRWVPTIVLEDVPYASAVLPHKVY